MKVLCDLFTEEEWQDVINKFKKPPKNRFVPDVPEGLKIIAKEELKKNKTPTEIRLSSTHTLYHMLDQVYHKPNTCINIVLRIR